MSENNSNHTYIGRFAPSPTGLLHQGSLLTAVASYLDARQQGGQWLVRMEDLDPPREQTGAADAILRTLEEHHLLWDGDVMYQSQRYDAYEEALTQLHTKTYRCDCNRQRLKSLGGIYDSHCLQTPPSKQVTCALRVQVDPTFNAGFEDLLQGHYQQNLSQTVGDFILKRKDNLYAYQLAVVVDDVAQGITHVIRGSDLLDSTPRQHLLFHYLSASPPTFGHLPVIINTAGQKLSKQTFATPIDDAAASANIAQSLERLNHPLPPELVSAPPEEQLQWSTEHWRREKLPSGLEIPE